MSIQIAICNEPVNSVIKTIKAASRQNYESFEVLVVYNNTSDIKLWLPIQLICEFLPNVRFFNLKDITGYKAGALNRCSIFMNPVTDYILTLDADYVLKPNALAMAVSKMEANDVDLLQFPQSYNNHSPVNGLAREFLHYFKSYSSYASCDYKNLPTGTLSLVDVDCLEKVGGWPTNSITEDAFLGVELIKRKCKLGYCDEVIGSGTMPSSTSDLKTQRMRWIFGNFQTLVHAICLKSISYKTKGLLIAQLTSWINLNGLPWLVLILIPVLRMSQPVDHSTSLVCLALLTIITNTIFQLIVFYRGFKNWTATVSSYLIHIANSIEGAFAWWGYFISKQRPFSRTNKFSKKVGVDLEQIIFNTLLLICGMIACKTVSISLGIMIVSSGMIRIVSRIYLYYSLRDARTHTFENLIS